MSYDPKVEAAAAMANVDCVDLANLPTHHALQTRWQAQLMKPPSGKSIAAIKQDAAQHGEMLRRTLLSFSALG
jgi:hypothetical protein